MDSQYKNSIAVILAAGRGTRLWPLTKETPKCLIPVGGLPILHTQLQAFNKNKITKVIIVVGFEAKKIEQYVNSHFPKLECCFVYNPIFKTTNTLYSLALASKKIPIETEVFQINGDVVLDPKIIALLRKNDSEKSYISVKKTRCSKEEIKALISKDGSIVSLNKKISPKDALGEAIGINKFSSQFWIGLSSNLKMFKNKLSAEYFEYAIEKTVSGGEKIFPLDIGSLKVIEIDSAQDLKRARLLFSRPKK